MSKRQKMLKMQKMQKMLKMQKMQKCKNAKNVKDMENLENTKKDRKYKVKRKKKYKKIQPSRIYQHFVLVTIEGEKKWVHATPQNYLRFQGTYLDFFYLRTNKCCSVFNKCL